ncbi:hypothetical protein [Gimesia fumaroli]|uniref:Uncharacterized protein n=1 Tax=Gimesia fumaroli TaxID=2527976 RepID=A0A518IL75_9PLAN|nr:hypothetical protein [Gimesia fumaroli]QDV53844.1 hypothetical protein Enr17x_59270 [Gimesia fumaroli]
MNIHRHKIAPQHTCWNKRSGFTIFEALISMILVSATVAISIPTLKVVNLQRKSINAKLIATTTLANLGERIVAENSWDDLTSEKMAEYEAEIPGQLNLKEPRLSMKLVQTENDPAVRQVRIRLSWENPYGESVDPLLLSLWFYREGSSDE